MARKRSEKCHLAILNATADLLEEHGYLGLKIEDVAARAGAGKQTIYRWWGGKPQLALEASFSNTDEVSLIADTGSVEGDLRAYLGQMSDRLSDSERARTIAGLMAEAQTNDAFAEKFRERFLEPKRRAMRAVFERGKARGELPGLANADLLTDLVYGPIWYRMLVGHAPLDRSFMEALITSVMAAARAPLCQMMK
ncbi:MAG: TetR/AcrR family transcriptional regulator [Myxococcota bacterium]